MTYEQKVRKILAAKQRIEDLRTTVRFCIATKEASSEINRWGASLHKAYYKYNKLKFKYWIFI